MDGNNVNYDYRNLESYYDLSSDEQSDLQEEVSKLLKSWIVLNQDENLSQEDIDKQKFDIAVSLLKQYKQGDNSDSNFPEDWNDWDNLVKFGMKTFPNSYHFGMDKEKK